MELADFDYDLPAAAIAQTPIEPRDRARLLVDRGPGLPPDHRAVADLPLLVGPGDVMVLNTTRVLPARLKLRKETGGAVEVLLLERGVDGHWDALVKPSRRVPPGTVLVAGDDLSVEMGGEGSGDGTRQVRLRLAPPATSTGPSGTATGEASIAGTAGHDAGPCSADTVTSVTRAAASEAGGGVDPTVEPAEAAPVEVSSGGADVGTSSVSRSDTAAGETDAGSDTDDVRAAELDVLARYGVVPLPPYITAPLVDPERYQTVYAERAESVAAPTAGLHLTPAVLDACRAAGAEIVTVELAVGLGTFRPMTADKVEDHEMHAERYRVEQSTLDACRDARRVVAVGTTAVRALESAVRTGELSGRTELFIHGDYDWQLVDVLLTNFHLPKSSLLVLIDAFVGHRWRDLYATARDAGYRFLSFGDAMLLARRSANSADPADPTTAPGALT